MRKGFLPLPLQRLQVLTAGMHEKILFRPRGLLSGRWVELLEPFFFHISIKTARTKYGLKGTYILIVCWFLPAGTADTGSIASLMRI